MNKYAKFFTSNDFLITRRDVLHLLKDIETTMFLTYLADKYKYFYTNNMITICNGKEYFFNIHNDIENSLYLSSHQQRKCSKILKELGILETILKGIPAKTFYHINFERLIDLLDKPIDNIQTTLSKSIDYPINNDSPITTTSQNNLQQDVKKFNNNIDNNLTHITNNKELITNTNNIKNKNSKINELIFQQQSEINNVFNDIFDLSVKYDFDNIDNQIKLNDMLKSENMNKLKKTYLDIKRENTIERKTFQNTLVYHKNNLKVNCLTSIWLYDYEILKLRMKYNADYFLKTIYKIDVWLQDPTNFAKKLDHYTTIENWIKKDIGHILEIKTHIRVDMYKYVNHGVDYDLFK